MALIEGTDTWQSATLTVDESWQVRRGRMLLFCQAGVTPAAGSFEFGSELGQFDSHFFAAGSTVYWRKAANQTGLCALNRNEISVA